MRPASTASMQASFPTTSRPSARGGVGGKARGLIFAMDYVQHRGSLSEHQQLIRFPDSVVVTTEAFDDFMAGNKLKDDVQGGCAGEVALEEVGHRIEQGTFSDRWRDALRPVIERKTRPLAVRSSSVMEDDTNHSFAGIYLSEFLPNRGPIDVRLDQLIASIKRVYASTFATNARAYRKRHDLDWREEKMAILIQDMIGSQYSHSLFYPLVGGVAFSRNYYPWSDRLQPEDGIVRLVVGTGTRAVGREYARVFSPRLPGLRPEGNDLQTIVRYSQETVDVLDMKLGRFAQRRLNELDNPLLTKVCSIVGADDSIREPLASAAMLASEERFLASFSRLIEGASIMPFTPMVREMLKTLESVLGLAVDIEFALDFSSPEASAQQTPLFYILQVRPLGSRHEHRHIRARDIPPERLVLRSHRVLGNGVQRRVKHIILVEPAAYRWDRAHDIARTIGRINNELVDRRQAYILMGPGRWASSNPQLGVPVQYNEISGATTIVEMSTATFAPELSYGTHFYADMVASDVLYIPFHEGEGDQLHRDLLRRQELVFEDEFVKHYRIPASTCTSTVHTSAA
ncbi:PEP/pyruvate-binding domain-containing protein [Candidatus Bipolaricaulota bacterium]